MNIAKNVLAYKQVLNIMKKNKYKFIHCHSPIGGLCGRLAGKRTKTKVIYTAHGFHFFKGAPPINWLVYYPIEYLLSKFTDYLFVVNSEDFEIASKRFKKTKTILLNGGVGIDVKNISKNNEEPVIKANKNLVSVGELNANKNHEIVIKSLVSYPELSDLNYLIVGEGVLRPKLEDLIIRNNLTDRVKLFGYRADGYKYIAQADIFIFPSLREGLPVSVMEAMALGKPIPGDCSSK